MYEDEKFKNDDVAAYIPATFGSRAVAYIVDGIIVSVISGVVLGATGRGESFALSTLISFLFFWYFCTRNDGQTPGKVMMRIKIIKTNGAPLSSTDVILRLIGYWVSTVCLGLGFIWAAFDSNSQAWHDKIAGTYVVQDMAEKKKKYVTV
jgi:uncharacterized RDD family membrane protein YckC